MNYNKKCPKCDNYACICKKEQEPTMTVGEVIAIRNQINMLEEKRRDILNSKDPSYPYDLPTDDCIERAKLLKEWRLECNSNRYTQLRALDSTINELEIKLL